MRARIESCEAWLPLSALCRPWQDFSPDTKPNDWHFDGRVRKPLTWGLPALCRAGRQEPRELSGVKRTFRFDRVMAAVDPKRTAGPFRNRSGFPICSCDPRDTDPFPSRPVLFEFEGGPFWDKRSVCRHQNTTEKTRRTAARTLERATITMSVRRY